MRKHFPFAPWLADHYMCSTGLHPPLVPSIPAVGRPGGRVVVVAGRKAVQQLLLRPQRLPLGARITAVMVRRLRGAAALLVEALQQELAHLRRNQARIAKGLENYQQFAA